MMPRHLIPPLGVVFTVLCGAVSAQTTADTKTEKLRAMEKNSGSVLSPAMKNLNRSMHSALRGAVQAERRKLGPLIVFEEGQMKFFRGDEEVAGYPVAPPLQYHRLKVLGHAAFAVVIQLHRSDMADPERLDWLQSTATHLAAVEEELPRYGFPAELETAQKKLIQRTQALIQAAQSGVPTHVDLKSYTTEIMPLLEAGFVYSARAHIDIIHAQAKKLFAQMTPAERKQVRGYFYGGRGAREGNLALQYVSWFVGENTGKESERIVFSEGMTERGEAWNALAKFSAERKLAELVMGDPAGLHRDVLSAATREYLKTFPPVEEAFAD